MDKPAHPLPIFDEDAVNEKIKQIPEEIKNRNVVVISIAGAFRLGKSFILNFLIRYMKYLCTPDDEKPTGAWLGDDDTPLEGFSWTPGSERDTIGILMWSEIFPVTLPNGEKDTQGTFDNNTTVKECAKIFALSTMLSSVQVYNLSKKIKEDDLQYLQLFADYGRLAAESTRNKALQNKLQFLVRDWSHPYDFEYGSAGGQKYIDKILKTSGKPPGLISLRNDIKSSFADIKCFLMPYPGVKVDTNPEFNGKLSDIETNFKAYLKDFVTDLLSPQNMNPKEINGEKINVSQWFMYLERFIHEFSHDSLPEPKSLFEATADANNLSAVAEAKETYDQSMLQAFECSKPFLTSEEFDNHHRKFKALAIEQFREKRKMGTEEFCESHRLKLEDSIRSSYNQFKLLNNSKKEASMQATVTRAKKVYGEFMLLCENAKPYLSSNQFKHEHEKFAKKALDLFDAYCEKNVDDLSDEYRNELLEHIETDSVRFWAFNKHRAEANNQSAIKAAKEIYHKQMLEATENSKSLTLEELEQEHVKHEAVALQEFINKCVAGEDEFSQRYKKELKKDGYIHFKTLNNEKKSKAEAFNLSAAQSAKNAYNRLMTIVLEKPQILNSDQFNDEHQKCKTAAVEQFRNSCDNDDEFSHECRIKLEKDIDMDRNCFQTWNENKDRNNATNNRLERRIERRNSVRDFFIGTSLSSIILGTAIGGPLGPLIAGVSGVLGGAVSRAFK